METDIFARMINRIYRKVFKAFKIEVVIAIRL